MKNNISVPVTLAAMCLILCGCMSVLWQTGRLAENAAAKHEVDGFADASLESVGKAAQAVLQSEGTILSGSAHEGKIVARIREVEVKVTWDEVSAGCVRIRVRVEDSKMTKMDPEDLTDEIYGAILGKIR